MTAYADDRFPGLAIHGPWELGSDDWRITHVPSGLIIATLPTRAAATAALEIIGKLQDWNRPQAEVAGYGDKGMTRWLRTSIAAAVERVNSDRAAALKAAVESGTIKGTALEAALGDFRCDKMRRAWRTRSPVTHGNWTERARKLLGKAAGLDDVGQAGRRPLCRRQRLQPRRQLPAGGLDAAHLEAAFRPLADLPRGVARKGPFARAV